MTFGSFADFVAGTAVCDPRCADFVAGAALGEPWTCRFRGRQHMFVSGARIQPIEGQCASFTDLQLQEVDQIMIIMRCLPQEIHRHLAFHGKSTTMKELLESPSFYERQSRALEFARGSQKGNPVGYDKPPKGAGKDTKCRRCGKPGHFEEDCWAKSPKRTDQDKGKGKDKAKGKEKGKGKPQSPHRDGKGNSTL